MIRRFRLSEMPIDQILCRDIRAERNVDAIVDEIIADVRANGDEALRRYAEKFDRAKLEALEESDLDFLAESAYADACRPGNPKDTSVEDLKDLFRKLM